ncbi:hypothetical protein G4G27_03315 [Sphingomonas sp. So64.6b]|uniref:hypothetical protein n=1 Tax=Sphingomonas sp. So64.6b TaxID=2997354 RepID=UPI0015FF8116|nr:hypothetical protein [Sphingomonas sp. So64.6b]QNA83145.1 hypothetical protein G4G27_03315 [Sphingomonas sp. So64.6b]
MTNSILMALAGAVMMTATPALANDPAAPAAANKSAAQPDQANTKSKTTKYCVKDTRTGSRLATTLCLTRDDWLKRNFDPLEK